MSKNWLCCAACSACICHQTELLLREIPVLKEAVYAYRLDVLDQETPVYSATNTADNRFDVLRCRLEDSISVPETQRDRVTGLREFLRHLQFTAVTDMTDPHQLLTELEELEVTDSSQTSSEESQNKRRDPLIIHSRLVSSTEPSEEYTWFPGFHWTFASCFSCGDHLGWVFWTPSKENESQLLPGWDYCFISLIVTKLREKQI